MIQTSNTVGLFEDRTCEINCSSVTQSCPTLCDPTDCSTPGFPFLCQLLELAQTPVHRVSDAIQPPHPLLSPSPPAFNLSQHQGLFQWVSSLHQAAKVLSYSFNISPFSEYSGLISFRMKLVGSPCSPGDSQESSPTPQYKSIILQCSAFFMVQLSYPYMTTGKTITLTGWTFVSKVMSLLFNMLSRLVIAFLPRSKSFNFTAAVTICSDFGTPKIKVSRCFHCFPHLFAMKGWDQMSWS